MATAGIKAGPKLGSMVLSMASKKITVTIPEDLLEEVRAEAAERGVSAYVARALRLQLDRDRLRELVTWLEEEYGPVTAADRAAAREELAEIDAEHERRRAATGARAAAPPQGKPAQKGGPGKGRRTAGEAA